MNHIIEFTGHDDETHSFIIDGSKKSMMHVASLAAQIIFKQENCINMDAKTDFIRFHIEGEVFEGMREQATSYICHTTGKTQIPYRIYENDYR